MRIWHVGASPFARKVDGVNSVVWLVARAQAELGHEVCLLLGESPDEDSRQLASDASLHLLHAPAGICLYSRREIQRLLHAHPPDAVHFHSVFVPAQAALARWITRMGIPYVITPHGGLSAHVLSRGRLKKTLYSWMVEKSRFRGAAAITVVTPSEEQEVRAFIPKYDRTIRCVPNPVEVTHLVSDCWKGAGITAPSSPRVVYLGRFDVAHKGIDLFLEIARRTLEAEFHLYGIEDAKTRRWLERLRSNASPNIHFHGPVFGRDKTQVLAQATVYLQTSRWDASPVSVAEALFLGVPCAITETMSHSVLFREGGLGLTLPFDADIAAERLRALLSNSAQLKHYSERSRQYARERFLPSAAAADYLQLYQQVLPNRPATAPAAAPGGGRELATQWPCSRSTPGA